MDTNDNISVICITILQAIAQFYNAELPEILKKSYYFFITGAFGILQRETSAMVGEINMIQVCGCGGRHDLDHFPGFSATGPRDFGGTRSGFPGFLF